MVSSIEQAERYGFELEREIRYFAISPQCIRYALRADWKTESVTAERDALKAEVERLREVEKHARRVMDLLDEHGASIVPHLMDTDDNAGQFLREALKGDQDGK